MLLSSVQMAALSLIPSVLICVFVYFRDKKEKEPLWLLGLLFASAAVLYVPVYYLGGAVNGIFDDVYAGKRELDVSGMLIWSDPADEYIHHALCAFVGIALIEECSRWLLLFFITSKSKHFNCLFDGVIYSVFASMGSALACNIVLALTSGWELFILKFASSFPWYLFFGIVMGIFYTGWHTRRGADTVENRLIKQGELNNDKLKYPVFSLILGMLVPTLLHAFYSYAEMVRSPELNKYLFIFAAIIFVICVAVVIFLSKKDKTKKEAIDDIIQKSHSDYSPDSENGGSDE